MTLLQPTYIVSVTTQGRADSDQWVEAYKVKTKFALETDVWEYVNDYEEFRANKDRNTKVTNEMPRLLIASWVALEPTRWHDHISLRWGVSGYRVPGFIGELPLNYCKRKYFFILKQSI